MTNGVVMMLFDEYIRTMKEAERCVRQIVHVETNHRMTRIEHLQLSMET